MKCESCDNDTNDGQKYTFYKGYKIGASSEQVGSNLVTTTRYTISGSETVYLCPRCVTRYISQYVVLMGVAFAFLIGLVLGCRATGVLQASFLPTPQSWLMAGAIAMFIPLALILGGLAVRLAADRASLRWLEGFLSTWDNNYTYGDQTAIRLRAPRVRSANTTYFTRLQRSRLK